MNNPWDFAEALLDAEPSLSGEILRKMVGGREKQVNLYCPEQLRNLATPPLVVELPSLWILLFWRADVVPGNYR